MDAGEKPILEALSRGQTAYVCASRGLTGNCYGHPLQEYGIDNEEFKKLAVPIKYAPDTISEDSFRQRYPELALAEISMWRKSFDDDGNVIFIHRGRGTTRRGKKDRRGDFIGFVKDFYERSQEL